MIKVLATGFIAQKPELQLVGAKRTPKCEFDVCWDRRQFVNGNWEPAWERATFVAWEAEAEKIAERLDKGTTVDCIGVQETSHWVDQSQQKRKSIKHRLLAWNIVRTPTPPGEGQSRQQPAGQPSGRPGQPQQGSNAPAGGDPGFDDKSTDIPF